MDDNERKYLMTRRQCLIMELGAVEDRLGMERSIVPKRKRERPTYDRDKEMMIAVQYHGK